MFSAFYVTPENVHAKEKISSIEKVKSEIRDVHQSIKDGRRRLGGQVFFLESSVGI